MPVLGIHYHQQSIKGFSVIARERLPRPRQSRAPRTQEIEVAASCYYRKPRIRCIKLRMYYVEKHTYVCHSQRFRASEELDALSGILAALPVILATSELCRKRHYVCRPRLQEFEVAASLPLPRDALQVVSGNYGAMSKTTLRVRPRASRRSSS